MHVARTDVFAVDAIDRACFSLDTSRNFQRLLIVHGGWRRTVGIVDGHRHFGVIARGAVAGACENDGVHIGGAQRLVRGLTHCPAQSLDQIRFAAAVRPDDAGETGFDQEVGRLDKGLESVEAKTRQLHAVFALWAKAKFCRRDRAIDP